MRRLRAIQTIAPGALDRLIAALDLPDARAARLRADPRFSVFRTGGAAPRASLAALRKALVSAQLDGRADHRSGAYRLAWAKTSSALSRE